MNIRVLVVDDEPLARVGITTRLSAYSDTLVVGDPRAPAIAMRLEHILKNYPMTYDSLTAALAKRYSDFMVNAKYHSLRRALEAERKFCFPHPINPTKPKGAVQRLYDSTSSKNPTNTTCAEPNASIGASSPSHSSSPAD